MIRSIMSGIRPRFPLRYDPSVGYSPVFAPNFGLCQSNSEVIFALLALVRGLTVGLTVGLNFICYKSLLTKRYYQALPAIACVLLSSCRLPFCLT